MASSMLLIKNMVCHRCVLAVKDILVKEVIPFQKVTISQVWLNGALSEDQKARLLCRLKNIGFELIDSRSNALIEQIKQLVLVKARNEMNADDANWKLSSYITNAVHHEYTYLSSLFSAVEGRTIEKYFIDQRVEKVKELLIHGQLSLSQMAFDLGFSSAAHLSTQFKRITGLTPTYFREMTLQRPVSLNAV